MSIKDQVIEIIADQAVLEPSDVKLDMTIEDLGLDSLGVVEAVFAFEEQFEISVPFNANDPSASQFDISSVQSIITAVEHLVAAKDG